MRGRTALGTHRHAVLVQSPGAPVADGDGGYTEGWTTADPALWRCAIEPATARDLERVAAGTVISTASHIISGRYHPAITTATRLVFQGRAFQVTGVSDPEERHIRTICVCVELLGAALIADYMWAQLGWISRDPEWVQEGTF